MRLPILCLLAFSVAACSQDNADRSNESISNEAVAVVPATTNEVEANQVAPVATTGGAAVDLNVYVDKYPFDKVGGVSFDDQPAVRAAVAKAVPDATIRDWIFNRSGPASPIAKRGDKIASWACQQHNCGSHQWAVLITPDASNAEVCYLADGASSPVWYADGKKTARTDSCQVEG